MCSQFCFPDRWKPSSETQRHHRSQSRCNPLDMIWMYSEEICTTRSFQCWNQTQFATFFSAALWAWQGAGAGEQGQPGAQHPLGQHCPCCCDWLSWTLYVGRETPLIRARLHDSHSGTEEVSPMATEARLLFGVSLSHS